MRKYQPKNNELNTGGEMINEGIIDSEYFLWSTQLRKIYHDPKTINNREKIGITPKKNNIISTAF